MTVDTDFGAALDALSFPWLALLAVGMVLAPWPFDPQPHLIAKTRMALEGTLTQPIDVVDLVVHALPSLLLGAKVVLMVARR